MGAPCVGGSQHSIPVRGFTPELIFSPQAEQKADDDKKEKKPKKEPAVKESAKYERGTRPGERKDTSCPLPDAYSPQYVEVMS